MTRSLTLKRSWSYRILAACMLCFMAFPVAAKERQYKIEAAFLYNFFNYITWPGYESSQELQNPVICIYGNDPIKDYLEYIQQRMSDERLLEIRNIYSGDSLKDCHLFFMRHRISLAQFTGVSDSTLTVFILDDPLDRGGMIELSEDEGHIAIHINQSLLKQRGYQISSRLLDLARVR